MTATQATAVIPKKVHLVGIGGAHMSAIAQILHAWGHTVTGSDQKTGAMTEKLSAMGIDVRIGHAAENIGDAELVVFTSAAHGDNPEIAEAQRHGIPAIKRAEMVARLMQGRYSIAVAGTHGKTTTSGLIAHMLVEAKLDPTYLIGGEVRSLGTNAAPGKGRYIVVEADEYDRAFLSYTPDVAVVTNIEPDHLDIYGTVEELESAFVQFMSAAPADGHVIASADSPRAAGAAKSASITARDIATFALQNEATWKATGIVPVEGGQTFSVSHRGNEVGTFTISLSGEHNVSNALAGIAAGSTIGIETEVMRAALATYRGAQRRFELVGEAAGVTVMDDYAHHPTEVREGTIAPARQRFPGRRLVLLFQPHTYTRTSYLLDEWKACFAGADAVYITHTYAAREEPEAGLSGADLASALEPAAVYVDAFEDAADRIANDLREGDVFFTVGAGDVDSVGPMVLERLRSRWTVLQETKRAMESAASSTLSFTDELRAFASVRVDEPLARHTTFGIGGPADLFVTVRSEAQLAEVVRTVRRSGAPLFVLGAGSNVLVGDNGIRGVVIDNQAKFFLDPPEESDDGYSVEVASGVSFAVLARHMARSGFGGIEWAAGIPGTMGGAVVYNAGAYGGCLADVLEYVGYIDEEGRSHNLYKINEDDNELSVLHYAYRSSAFLTGDIPNAVVTSLTINVAKEDPAVLMARIAEYDRLRLDAQPRGRNSGSVFKNPAGDNAWRLIDEVGLRGHRIGDAQISNKHSNFIENLGQARAADVAALIREAQARVRERFGIELETEVELVGEGFE